MPRVRIVSVLVLLAALGLLVPAAVRLTGWHGLYAEMLISLRVQYALAAAALLIAWGMLRAIGRVRGAAAPLAALVALAVNAAPAAQFMMERGTHAAAGRDLTVLAANIHLINRDAAPFAQLVQAHRPDVLIMVELTPEWLDGLSALHGPYPYRISEPRTDSTGMALWSRLPIAEHALHRFDGKRAPILTATIEVEGTGLRVAAMHPPPPVSDEKYAARQHDLAWVARWARAAPEMPTLVAGDLNITVFSPDFDDFLAAAALGDPRRSFGLLPSWPAPLPWPLRIPIDHLLANDRIAILDVRLGADVGSDHLPLIAEMALKRRSGGGRP